MPRNRTRQFLPQQCQGVMKSQQRRGFPYGKALADRQG